MRTNLQSPTDLVIFTEDILKGKFHFLRREEYHHMRHRALIKYIYLRIVSKCYC